MTATHKFPMPTVSSDLTTSAEGVLGMAERDATRLVERAQGSLLGWS
jgi:hypothetical protein